MIATVGYWLPTAVAILLLAVVATAVLGAARIHQPLATVAAIARATVQLAALSLVLSGILTNGLWVAIGLVVMFLAATWTVSRRTRADLPRAVATGVAMLLGAGVAIGIVFATGAVEFSPRYVLAVGGIVIGNAMSVATLTTRTFRSGLIDHWDEVEGWLSLGARPLQSTRWISREAIYSALVPSIDQTRTTGIVVLPGAFVGAIFGGASPLEAGRFQIIVLASVLAAGAITSTALLRLIGSVAVKPTPELRAKNG